MSAVDAGSSPHHRDRWLSARGATRKWKLMDLTEYREAREAVLPDYCRDLRVFSYCDDEDEGLVIAVFVDEVVREERAL